MKTDKGWTPAIIAGRRGNQDVVKFLEEASSVSGATTPGKAAE